MIVEVIPGYVGGDCWNDVEVIPGYVVGGRNDVEVIPGYVVGDRNDVEVIPGYVGGDRNDVEVIPGYVVGGRSAAGTYVRFSIPLLRVRERVVLASSSRESSQGSVFLCCK